MRKHGIEKGGDESLSSCGWFESGKTTGVEERKKRNERDGEERRVWEDKMDRRHTSRIQSYPTNHIKIYTYAYIQMYTRMYRGLYDPRNDIRPERERWRRDGGSVRERG